MEENASNYISDRRTAADASVLEKMSVFATLELFWRPRSRYQSVDVERSKLTSGSAARHPSLYLALRARPWIRISQSYDVDMSDVATTLMLFAAATASRTTESWQ